MGFQVKWKEPPYQWVESGFVEGERLFVQGPVDRGGFRMSLSADGDATAIEAEAWVEGSSVAAWLIGPVVRSKLAFALRRYLDAMVALLEGWKDVASHPTESPSLIAHRLLLRQRGPEVATGKTSPMDHAQFVHRLRAFRDAPVSDAIKDSLARFLQDSPDEDVAVIRPFEVARAWDRDRRDTLRAFLHAARAGLTDLRWEILCPSCRVASERHERLEGLSPKAHCQACAIEYDVDFGDHVEAVFQINPALRLVETPLYCASSPWFRPHVFAQIRLDRAEERELRTALPPAGLLVRAIGGKAKARWPEDAPRPQRLRITTRSEAIDLQAEGSDDGSGTLLVLRNDSGEPLTLAIERVGMGVDAVTGAVIATLPEFLDLFASEAPASGLELAVRSLTVLFSDLTGSTALYERVGDARAFAMVEEHFRAMGEAVARFDGAIVKTMGDAVMATFRSPDQAMLAAVEMIASTRRDHGGSGLSLKVGLHEGPCLAVRANDRLDFFGTTVNVAARLQAQACGGQVVVMADLLEHQGVAAVVRDHKLSKRVFEAFLKGISQPQQLAALE